MLRKIISICIIIFIIGFLGEVLLIVIKAVYIGLIYALKQILIEGDWSLKAFKDLGKMLFYYVLPMVLFLGIPSYFFIRRIFKFLQYYNQRLTAKLQYFGNK